MTPSELKEHLESGELVKHHTALKNGYVSVKSDGIILDYHGRFGEGYAVYNHNPDSTRFCYVTYYILKEEINNGI